MIAHVVSPFPYMSKIRLTGIIILAVSLQNLLYKNLEATGMKQIFDFKPFQLIVTLKKPAKAGLY